MNNADYWFSNIPGPSSLVNAVADALSNEKTVILCIDYDFPWRGEMRDAVANRLKEYPDSSNITLLDVNDQYLNEGVGKFIIRRFGTEEDFSFVRNETEAIKFLKQTVLRNRVIWFKGIPNNNWDEFISFCRSYKNYGRDSGSFVIEIRSNAVDDDLIPWNIQIIRSSDFITENDVLIFSSILYGNNGVVGDYGKYFSNLVTSICQTDAELAADMVNELDFRTIDPLTGLQIVKEKFYSNSERGVSPLSNHSHPFSLLENNNYDELQSRVWLAQIRSLLPVIENERRRFIRDYKNELEYCYEQLLGHQESWTNPYFSIGYDEDCHIFLQNQFNEPIHGINDFEINHLVLLAGIRNQENHEIRLLTLSSYQEMEHLIFLRDIRNNLAHINCCTPDTIVKLLKE